MNLYSLSLSCSALQRKSKMIGLTTEFVSDDLKKKYHQAGTSTREIPTRASLESQVTHVCVHQAQAVISLDRHQGGEACPDHIYVR